MYKIDKNENVKRTNQKNCVWCFIIFYLFHIKCNNAGEYHKKKQSKNKRDRTIRHQDDEKNYKILHICCTLSLPVCRIDTEKAFRYEMFAKKQRVYKTKPNRIRKKERKK